MAGFDPKAYLAKRGGAVQPDAVIPPARPGEFDPRAYLASRRAPAPAPAVAGPAGASSFAFNTSQETPRDVGRWESFWRGAAQELTLGFQDEIAGGIDFLSGGDYTKGRDESRKLNKEAQDANPGTYLAGQVVGGVGSMAVPFAGAAGGAARGARAALKMSTALGAASGVGNSEAKSVVGVLRDAGVGAATGAVGGLAGQAVGKALARAPERVVARTIGDVTEGATAAQRDRLVGKAGKKVESVFKTLTSDPKLGKEIATRDATRGYQAVQQRISSVGKKLDKLSDKVDELAPQEMDPNLIYRKVEALRDSLKGQPGTMAVAEAVDGKLTNMLQAWGNRTRISIREARQFARDLGEAAFHGSPSVAPKQGKKIAQKLWGAVRESIDEHVDQVAKANPGAGIDLKRMKALNEQMSNLIRMEESLVYRATREATPSTTLSSRGNALLDTYLALQNLPALAAKKTLLDRGSPGAALGRAMDWKVARLVIKARRGDKAAQAKLLALKMGAATPVRGAANEWVVDSFRGNDDE